MDTDKSQDKDLDAKIAEAIAEGKRVLEDQALAAQAATRRRMQDSLNRAEEALAGISDLVRRSVIDGKHLVTVYDVSADEVEGVTHGGTLRWGAKKVYDALKETRYSPRIRPNTDDTPEASFIEISW